MTRIPGNGRHTAYGLEKIDEWLGTTHWNLIHFNWGLWDLCYRKDSKGKDKVHGKLTHTLEKYSANLNALVKRLKKTRARLVWASTTPIPEGEPGRFQGDEIRYNAAAKKIMEQNRIRINDLHAHVSGQFPDLAVGPGDVHFSKEGYEALAQQVAKVIAQELELKPI